MNTYAQSVTHPAEDAARAVLGLVAVRDIDAVWPLLHEEYRRGVADEYLSSPVSDTVRAVEGAELVDRLVEGPGATVQHRAGWSIFASLARQWLLNALDPLPAAVSQDRARTIDVVDGEYIVVVRFDVADIADRYWGLEMTLTDVGWLCSNIITYRINAEAPSDVCVTFLDAVNAEDFMAAWGCLDEDYQRAQRAVYETASPLIRAAIALPQWFMGAARSEMAEWLDLQRENRLGVSTVARPVEPLVETVIMLEVFGDERDLYTEPTVVRAIQFAVRFGSNGWRIVDMSRSDPE